MKKKLASQYEMDLIFAIAKRTEQMYAELGYDHCPERIHIVMALEQCHTSGCELALDALLACPSIGDFAHDVCGIMRHIDTSTGELRDCFSPRFSACYHRRGNLPAEAAAHG